MLNSSFSDRLPGHAGKGWSANGAKEAPMGTKAFPARLLIPEGKENASLGSPLA